ncbi:class I SAM-dependent methyltransferase [Pseudomonas sp. TWP3-1]|uniref:class I SAM-dependent methyltransferase n=1 Tax=Pseudomonas sp. TWP3-1 TaxID=2804631 RepID=UPI003CE72462
MNVEIDHARERALGLSMASHINKSGVLSCYIEPVANGLHQVFFLRVAGRDWVGRKVLQRADNGRWHSSSALKPSMLLGPHVESQWGNEGLAMYFQTVSPAEKIAALDAARGTPGSEIQFPFALIDRVDQEAVCPPGFWQCSEALATGLNADEAHLREYCAALLRTLVTPGRLIYDPACSTGEFIAHLASSLPDCRFLASDRSASMIEHARRQHAALPVDFRCLDAADATDAGIHCDVLILRFLNAEVLTRRQAQCVFESLVHCVRPGGTILIFGHTPVLIAVSWLAATLNLHLQSCVAGRSGQAELFQFYRLTVPTT